MLLPKLQQKIFKTLRSKEFWVLIIILGIGAYLRLWHIGSQFNAMEEYDEATLTLQARSIASGLLPYRDFLTVHPPLYYQVLAGIYKVFGYSLFYARYFSVLLSLASIVLIYRAGKKFYHTGAGLVAAALFAVSPDMVYAGRRAVQEALGIFLVVLTIYFTADFIKSQTKRPLIFAGLALGLALATKYSFLPAAIGGLLAVIIVLMGEKVWSGIKQAASPAFLLVWGTTTAVFLALAFFIVWAFNLPLAVPLLNNNDVSTGSIILTCGIFIMALPVSAMMLGKQLLFREWWEKFVAVLKKREIWYLTAGIMAGFLAVTGYFWISVPHEFISQTITLQTGRSTNFPSLITIATGALLAWGYLRLAFIAVLLFLPAAILMLNKKNITGTDYFITVAAILAVIVCQFFSGDPRYYYAVYPLFFVGLASFVPGDVGLISAEIKSLAVDTKIRIFVMTAVGAIFLLTSIVLIENFDGYDYGTPRLTNDEQYVYGKTIDYLESVAPNKVYAANPIFMALLPQLKYNPDVDTFAMIKLKKETAEQVIEDNINQGANYFVLDYWARNIGKSVGINSDQNSEIYDELEQAISQHAQLVQTIGTNSLNYVDIYELMPVNGSILNGDFSTWAKGEYTAVPAGWDPILLSGKSPNEDNAAIYEDNKDGKPCVRLEVTKTSLPDGQGGVTYCGIKQSISFPANELSVDIMPTFDGDTNQTAGMSFSGAGHTLTINFSDAVSTEEFVKSADGQSATVTRPANLLKWSAETINLAAIWAQAGWETPGEIQISFYVWTRYTSPGQHDLYIADISEK